MNAVKGTRVFAMVLGILATTALPAGAQITTGTVTGTVIDAQGGVIPGATVTLVSETQGTKSTPAVTNATGDFVFPNVRADAYTIEVVMTGFKTLKRSGITVNPGSRIAVGNLTIEVGGTTEVIDVRADASLIQAQTGERSFTIDTESVSNLPIGNRSFTALALLAPGVTEDGNQTPQRIGGGGDPNIMMDGVSTMDTGSNRPLLQMNVESIAQVKVLTSGYQAEFGRASGVQVSAVTKGGTNRFRGSAYDVERNSAWNPNSKTNKLNNQPKSTTRERDWGYTIGGPVGRAGGHNKLFFFYSQEFSPRTAGNNVVQFRVPTALEREGDFSQTTDNNGNLYRLIKDPRSSLACSNAAIASGNHGCFADGGIIGKIPANLLYQPGLNILNLWPLPNVPNPVGQSYNFELRRPAESVVSWQPAIRLDYQPSRSLRATFKYSGWKQRSQTFNGSIPGFNDARMQDKPVVSYTAGVSYTLTSTMFLEATFGHSQNELAGCAQAQSGTGPIFCTNAIPVGPKSSLAGASLQNLPFLFPNATVLDPGYYAVTALNEILPPFWDGRRMTKLPTFQWGSRIANANTPPNIGFPGWFNINATNDFSISLTKVRGRHTIKTGFYNTHSYKAEQTSNNSFGAINFQQEAAGTNPFDTSFGFSNAAVGTFSSFTQAQKYVETSSIYNNTEFYIQDNWKASARLTFDYGVRFVHQQAQFDRLGQASNFLPEKWARTAAPAMFIPGCASGVYPCSGNDRQAMNPLTGQFLGPNTSLGFGTLVPNSGNLLNGLYLAGQEGLPKATYSAPALTAGPRFGMAYDLTGRQTLVLRGGVGLYFDRPSSTTFSGGVNNPPTSGTTVVRYSQLQTLGSAGLTTQGAPALAAFPREIKLPSSTQWNSEVQMTLPWLVVLSIGYVGQHSFNTFNGVNINAIDFGAAFLPESQDPTSTPSATPGASALPTEALRPLRGYGNITQQQNRGWRTFHSIQVSFQRRFRDGVSFGFNDTISLSDKQQSGARLQHNADGTFSYRADQAQANELLGTNRPSRHIMRANFVWDLPDLKNDRSVLRAIGLVINDWQLSGIWAASTPSGYIVGFNYQNGGGNTNLTGSPDYGARVLIVGNPGKGCSSDPYRQFNTAAFQGPATGSDGLESGTGYLRSCFQSVLDLAIARNIRLPHGRNIQLRADMFNAPNEARITGRNTTMNLNNPADPVTITNPVFDAQGNVLPNRVRPNQAGFGAVSNYQGPRSVRVQVRFQF